MDWDRLKKIGELLFALVFGAIWIGAIGYFVIGFATEATGTSQDVKCETVSVPYKTQWVDTNDILGEESIQTAGVDGSDKVCKDGSGKEMSREIQTAPVTQVIGVGKIPESEWGYNSLDGEPGYEGGAICEDGSRSYSTGRGTCSHHGGVAQWL